MITTVSDSAEIDHIVASEQYRLRTFNGLTHFPTSTRRHLALAGFIYRQFECVCPQCGIRINLEHFDENGEYTSNYFRRLHRQKVSVLGKRCAFLLCEGGTNIDDLHVPLSSQQQPQWDDAEEPEFSNYNKRLQSFDNWSDSHQHQIGGAQATYVTPQAMAKHGFYFSGPADGVTCFYCGNTLRDWSAAICSTNENIVQLEHARFFPCRFVTYTAGGKFVANAGYFHTVSAQERRDRNPMRSQLAETTAAFDQKPRTIDECLATFENWPHYAPISGQALAETGFYYLGDELRVRCFMCNLEVSDWRHGMTALGTHRKRGNGCPIVLAIDSTQTGDIQTVNEKWRLETLSDLSFGESSSSDPQQTEANQRLCQELAACGFYRFKNTKHIRCAYCGVTIEPKLGMSVMLEHRHLTKQSLRRTAVATTDQSYSINVDCLMVRAQCPANVVIPHRQSFPEYPQFQSVFDRIKSFDQYKEQRKVADIQVRNMANAGFFFDEQRRMRCFQCGNSLPINDKARQEKYPHYSIAQLHAHYYPTCEWVKEILGVKYIAQVLHDRFKATEPLPQAQASFDPQASTMSFETTTSSSYAPTVTTPLVPNIKSPPPSSRFDEPFMSDQSAESSDDDEGFITVVPPPTTHFTTGVTPIRSPPPSAPPFESSTTEAAQTCSDPVLNTSRSQLTSPIMAIQINPFERWARKNQQQRRERTEDSISSDSGSHEMSPALSAPSAVSSPVDIRSLLAHESNRLETFKRLDRTTYGQVDVAHLAYVGFYLNTDGNVIQCPWCDVQLTEEHFEGITQMRPSVARATVHDEDWTPMRVHRHANGLVISQNRSWCTWVRREAGGLYPNVTLLESQMLYPEYPSYAKIEKRIKSFTSEWIYPSGSRLSNQMMAEAGFFYMGGDSVCCYYCGNKLQKFEPRDCPFEEHATFYPLCDFIQKVRGLDYINRIILEYGRIPQGRLRYEIDGAQRIKRIVFDKSGPTKRKTERPPVNRLNSSSTRSPSSGSNRPNARPISEPMETIDDACLICVEKPATHDYDPCQHFPMCGECFAGLEPEHLQRCMLCLQPATIRMRVPNTPLIP